MAPALSMLGRFQVNLDLGTVKDTNNSANELLVCLLARLQVPNCWPDPADVVEVNKTHDLQKT